MRNPFPSEAPLRSEINVTPLVDVCLVLLIIFMVVTPLIVQGRNVQLPETGAPVPLTETREQLTLTVGPGGLIYMGDELVSEAQLDQRLADRHKVDPDCDVRIRADRGVSYEEVRKVLRTARGVGFDKAGLVTLRRD